MECDLLFDSYFQRWIASKVSEKLLLIIINLPTRVANHSEWFGSSWPLMELAM